MRLERRKFAQLFRSLAFSAIIEEYPHPYIEFDSSAMVAVLTLVPPEVRCDGNMTTFKRRGLRGLTEVGFEVLFLARSKFYTRAQVDNTDGRKDGAPFSAQVFPFVAAGAVIEGVAGVVLAEPGGN